MNLGPCAFWNAAAESDLRHKKQPSAPPQQHKQRVRAAATTTQIASTTTRRARTAGPARSRRRLGALPLFLVAMTLIFALSAAGWRVWSALAPSGIAASVTVPVTVRPGDTLWSLAGRYGDPAANIRDRVDALAQSNRLPASAALIPGQRLLVSVRNPSEVAKLRREVARIAPEDRPGVVRQ